MTAALLTRKITRRNNRKIILLSLIFLLAILSISTYLVLKILRHDLKC